MRRQQQQKKKRLPRRTQRLERPAREGPVFAPDWRPHAAALSRRSRAARIESLASIGRALSKRKYESRVTELFNTFQKISNDFEYTA